MHNGYLINSNIAKNIINLRKKYNLTQQELGNIIGVSDKAVSTWERGLNVPRFEVIQKISDTFNISTVEIIGEISRETSNDTIADNIKQIRKKFNLTQHELGKIAGVGDDAVSSWERGISNPRVKAIQNISEGLGIPKSSIIEEKREEAPSFENVRTEASNYTDCRSIEELKSSLYYMIEDAKQELLKYEEIRNAYYEKNSSVKDSRELEAASRKIDNCWNTINVLQDVLYRIRNL